MSGGTHSDTLAGNLGEDLAPRHSEELMTPCEFKGHSLLFVSMLSERNPIKTQPNFAAFDLATFARQPFLLGMQDQSLKHHDLIEYGASLGTITRAQPATCQPRN